VHIVCLFVCSKTKRHSTAITNLTLWFTSKTNTDCVYLQYFTYSDILAFLLLGLKTTRNAKYTMFTLSNTVLYNPTPIVSRVYHPV